MKFSLLKILTRNFAYYKGRIAFFIRERAYLYDDLEKVTGKIQQLLRDVLPADEKLVGIYLSDHLNTYSAILACWFSGKGVVPLSPSFPGSRISKILKNTGIRTILYEGNCPHFEGQRDLLYVDTVNPHHEDVKPVIETDSPDVIQYILFTSGSTGDPKGVIINRYNFYSFFENFSAVFPEIDEQDRFLQIYDLSFDGSMPAWIFPLLKGAAVYTVPYNKIKYLEAIKLIREHKLTVLKMPPSTLSFLSPYLKSLNLPWVKCCMFGGEALPASLIKVWEKCVPDSSIYNVYGPTESTVISALYNWSDKNSGRKEQRDIISIGKALGSNEIQICDENMDPVKQGTTGEILIGGPQVAVGYWMDQEKTSAAFANVKIGGREKRYFRTGDLGFKDADGYIMFSGRNDEQVQVNGYRVEPGEIEHTARRFNGEANVAVISKKDSERSNRLYLFIENMPGEKEELLKNLKNELPAYMLPFDIIYLKEFPLTNGGKTDRNQLGKLIPDDKR